MKTIKTEIPNMELDPATGTVINKDVGAYAAIKAAREEKKRQFRMDEKLLRLEQRVESLEAQLDEARAMGSIL